MYHVHYLRKRIALGLFVGETCLGCNWVGCLISRKNELLGLSWLRLLIKKINRPQHHVEVQARAGVEDHSRERDSGDMADDSPAIVPMTEQEVHMPEPQSTNANLRCS